jgi:hypothetical protein
VIATRITGFMQRRRCRYCCRSAMDDNRIVNGLAPTPLVKPVVQQSQAAGNDLEDSGGPGYQRLRRKAKEAAAAKPAPPVPQALPPEDDPALELLDTLERQRTTDAAVKDSREDLRRLRGLHHYREKDPETSRFFRRRRESTAADDEPDEAAPPGPAPADPG